MIDGIAAAENHSDRDADGITITEYEYVDFRSDGADIECKTFTASRKHAIPSIVGNLGRDLRELGISDAALNITDINRNNELVHCLSAILILITTIGTFLAFAADHEFIGFTVLSLAFVALILIWLFSSRMECQFRVHCVNNDFVNPVLRLLRESHSSIGIISTTRRYRIDSQSLSGWSENCIERANARAGQIAKSFGRESVQIASYEEFHTLPKRFYTSDKEDDLYNASNVSGPDESSGPLSSALSFGKSRATLITPGTSTSDGNSGGMRVGMRIRARYRLS